jgi:hypothetical protein
MRGPVENRVNGLSATNSNDGRIDLRTVRVWGGPAVEEGMRVAVRARDSRKKVVD